MKRKLTKLLMLLGVFLLLGAANASAKDVYIVGNMNNWTEGYPDYKLTQKNSNEYEITLSLDGGMTYQFKFMEHEGSNKTWVGINNTNWNDWIGTGFSGDDNNSKGTEKELIRNGGENIQIHFSNNANIQAKITLHYWLEYSGKPRIKVSSEAVNYPSKMFIIGNVDATTFQPNLGKELKSLGDGIYTGCYDFKGTYEDWAYFQFTDRLATSNNWDNGGIGQRYGAPSGNYSVTEDERMDLEKSSNSYQVKQGKYYVVVDMKFNKVCLTPITTELYLYGHVNDRYWAPNNYVVLTQEGNTNKYSNDYVEIGGFWSQKDCDIFNRNLPANDPSRRKLYEQATTNYVALYNKKNTSLKNFDKYISGEGVKNESAAMKFGSKWSQVDSRNENNFDKYGETFRNCDLTKRNNSAHIIYQREFEFNNFVIPSGFYKITVDLDEGTIKLEQAIEPERPRTYVWYTGVDEMTKNSEGIFEITSTAEYINGVIPGTDGYHSKAEFQFEPNQPAIVQAGIGENTEHVLARMVQYDVYYKPYEGKKNAKRNADELDDNTSTPATAIDDVTASNMGYTKVYSTANPSVNNGTVTATEESNSNYDTNYVLQLHKAGEYIITANKPSTDANEVTGLENGNLKIDNKEYNVTETSLFATVAAANVEITLANTYLPFWNDPTATESFEIVGSESLTESDVVAAFVPYNNATGWATTYDNLSANLVAEKDAMVANGKNVDGIYSDSYQSNVKVIDQNGTLYVNVPALPCSGRYILSVTPAAGSNYTFNATADVYVYPTSTLQFGESRYSYDDESRWTSGMFNVNGINWTTDASYSGLIKYPIMADGKFYWEDSLGESRMYTPGVYMYNEMKVNVIQGADPTSKSAKKHVTGMSYDQYTSSTTLANGYTGYNPNETFDMSGLKNYDQVIYVYLNKNGAYTPIESTTQQSYESYLVKASNSYTLPTGVEAIGADVDGEAVYFNLQGVKVQNPEHGIYVKVQNGKATKVVL